MSEVRLQSPRLSSPPYLVRYKQMTDEQVQQLLSRDNVDVINRHGTMLYFSVDSFIKHIAGGDVCFICGADPKEVTFNNEHVIPDWLPVGSGNLLNENAADNRGSLALGFSIHNQSQAFSAVAPHVVERLSDQRGVYQRIHRKRLPVSLSN